MEKDFSNQKFDETNLNFKGKANKEVLEISSTGYGYESVSIDPKEEETSQDGKDKNFSCGGL
ncbi:hypothetical protein [Neobacillus sp. PS3-40]|uniref:hypothetical protein n=1 Tax=Neobacillus sp. PS3-40 TaxID=3070679 RepID=UPI0027DEBE81|nr:hypothetical protein [Neobacillus sp. PS3-40]WML44665.1 hypothetical protein RCG20_01760 [Neobacillus sp. PS3-40]